ncbi:MerR family transcriptional regulator [Candidatus Oleimmundimicrobium sp.]|uniref:transcriptional regulator FtsR n=1 Tax=Candidatus Oleimmundimicrobium sp. TaxID=3060597 RepID=UPI002720D1C8|nr:MerR family transcriptional regulator [Candidatus Oleimmundimicrobium sp.]MDO8885326.1 MerR family transcriptional regulator [Candidatus Oleimmundimicrobium sp.]
MFRSSERDYATISEVVKELRKDYPDLSISKVRYLEEEGLIKPERTSGGYRKFKPVDVDKLRTILRLQKDNFLPLNIIKSKLKSLSFGKEVYSDTAENLASSLDEETIYQEQKGVKIDDVPNISNLSFEEIKRLETYNILQPEETEEGKVYSSVDVKIMKIVKQLADFGIEPRHIRFYENFAEREASFYQQILLPSFKQKSEEGKIKAMEELSALIKLTQELKNLLLQKSIKNYFQTS